MAELSSFALELTKKMNMQYRSPPLPVDLSVTHREGVNVAMLMDLMNARSTGNQESGDGDDTVSHVSHDSTDYAAVSAMFDKK
jgi:hypothetical protein